MHSFKLYLHTEHPPNPSNTSARKHTHTHLFLHHCEDLMVNLQNQNVSILSSKLWCLDVFSSSGSREVSMVEMHDCKVVSSSGMTLSTVFGLQVF